jgi:hypothetical protein
MEDNHDNRDIQIIACDVKTGITVEASTANMIGCIDPEILDEEEGEKNPRFPLNKVRHKELERVVKFCDHCVKNPYIVEEIENVPRPFTTFRMRGIFSSWIADFISKIPIGELFDLLAAADYMEVDVLVELITIPVSMLIVLEADEGETNKIFTECNYKVKKKKKKGKQSSKVTKNKELLKDLVKNKFK